MLSLSGARPGRAVDTCPRSLARPGRTVDTCPHSLARPGRTVGTYPHSLARPGRTVGTCSHSAVRGRAEPFTRALTRGGRPGQADGQVLSLSGEGPDRWARVLTPPDQLARRTTTSPPVRRAGPARSPTDGFRPRRCYRGPPRRGDAGHAETRRGATRCSATRCSATRGPGGRTTRCGLTQVRCKPGAGAGLVSTLELG